MPEVTYTCTACGEEYSDDASLTQHMVTDHTKKTEVTTEGEAK